MGITLAETVRDVRKVSRIINEIPKESRGSFAETLARSYMNLINDYGDVKGLKDSEPDVYEFSDCMNAALLLAKKEAIDSRDAKSLERLGYLFVEAKSRKNAIECLRALGNSIGVEAKSKLEWLEDFRNKGKLKELGLCDETANDFRYPLMIKSES